jgi:hypothetical protein
MYGSVPAGHGPLITISGTLSCASISRAKVAEALSVCRALRPLRRSWVRRADGNELVAVRPTAPRSVLEAPSKWDRIDPVEKMAQPAFARNAVMEFRGCSSQATISSKLSHEAIVAHATRSRISLSGIHHSPAFVGVIKLAKMPQ